MPEPTGGAENVGDATKSPVVLREEATLARWREKRIFERSLERPSPRGELVFYDGPPFATGLPHFGHVLPSSVKDAIPRYLTMRGYRVPRVWGWDCHGVPIENLVQKELGLKTRADVERAGLAAFAKAARASVLRYDAEWKRIVPRLGRWIDMEHSYKTMDPGYTESVWWAWGELHKKGLAYEGFKSVHVSPALETPLSNFEVAQAYQDIDDLSVTVKLPIVGEPGVSLLAWTTTPWTLPGNVAVAVHPELEYAYVESEGSTYIVGVPLVEKVFGEKPHTVRKAVSGSTLVGRRYEPLFPECSAYPADKSKLWQVFAGNFVTAEDGTGVVHIATGFGEDDLQLGQREGLPVVQHVGIDGRMNAGIPELDGRQAKPAEDPAQTDVEVVKLLATRGKLFAKAKFRHSYPHCWRTGVPLLNYALSSWFVKVSAVREKLVKLNRGVRWVPESIGQARFGNWLAEAKDWSVSRARFWGTPLPIWKSASGKVRVVSSLAELRSLSRSANSYLVMRHGEAKNVTEGFVSRDDLVPAPLTEVGVAQVRRLAQTLSGKVDRIFASPLLRCRETAEIVRSVLGLSDEQVVVDRRLREIDAGGFAGGPISAYRDYFAKEPDPELARFTKRPIPDRSGQTAETLRDVRRRVGEFLYEVDRAHAGERILIVAHEYVVWMLEVVARGADDAGAAALKTEDDYVRTGEARELDFTPLPHDEEYALDFHRPYIDEIVLWENGEELRRIPDVFDTWFDSGSVPFASQGYPMSAERFAPASPIGRLFGARGKGFPAAFVAEGVDQTRGWFYTMMVLSGILFGRAPYERVVVNGTILAEDGRKMSKSLGNFPPVESVVDRYGADALRLALLGSPAVRGEDGLFSERGVDEVSKKIVQRLGNVLSFYAQSVGKNPPEAVLDSSATLDRWIVSRTAELAAEVTAGMEAYELDRAVRPLFAYADDLSNWYLRRSRDRLRDKDSAAQSTLRAVLLELAKLLAPFAPFLAEQLYLGAGGPLDSVHLENWPLLGKPDAAVLAGMFAARAAASLGLEARAKSGLKARQPLQTLVVKDGAIFKDRGLVEAVRDEVNVKEVKHDPSLPGPIDLDTALSQALRQEGFAREVMRLVQDARKKLGLATTDQVFLTIDGDKYAQEALEPYRAEILAKVNAKELRYNSIRTGGEILEANGYKISVGVSLE